jgi:hypothetical protein
MFQLALIGNGHRLKAAMWMLAHAARRGGRRKHQRAGIVRQQERADMLDMRLAGKQRAHGKTIAAPVRPRAAVDAEDPLH